MTELYSSFCFVDTFPSWPQRWRIGCDVSYEPYPHVVIIASPDLPVKDLWFATKSDAERAIDYLAQHGIRKTADLDKVSDVELLRLAYEGLAW